MARIVDFKFLQKRTSIQNAVETSYSYGDVNGERYLSIYTYGSLDRQSKGEVSQVIQLDKKSAEKLISILKGVFSF